MTDQDERDYDKYLETGIKPNTIRTKWNDWIEISLNLFKEKLLDKFIPTQYLIDFINSMTITNVEKLDIDLYLKHNKLYSYVVGDDTKILIRGVKK